VALAALLAAGAAAAWVDPYWLWRDAPTGPQNRVLDLKTRFAKAAQLISREADVLFLGSSTVYRGLDPTSLDPSRRAYNLGISSLRIVEARAYLIYALRHLRLDTVVLGLNYFMFDSRIRAEPGFEPRLEQPGYGLAVLTTALFSLDALKDCLPDRDADAQARADGMWRADGFKQTNPRTPADVEHALETDRRYSVTAVPDARAYQALRELIRAGRGAGARVKVYISPIHHRLHALFAAESRIPQYDAWRQQVAVIAGEEGAEFLDFSGDVGIARSPLDGHSGYFFDSLHFMPSVGNAILDRLGLPLRRAIGELPELPERRAAPAAAR
jgi:hypothetical protein